MGKFERDKPRTAFNEGLPPRAPAFANDGNATLSAHRLLKNFRFIATDDIYRISGLRTGLRYKVDHGAYTELLAKIGVAIRGPNAEETEKLKAEPLDTPITIELERGVTIEVAKESSDKTVMTAINIPEALFTELAAQWQFKSDTRSRG